MFKSSICAVLCATGRAYESTMLASSCTANPDFSLCGWAAADDAGADSGTGVAREFGQNMHPVSHQLQRFVKFSSSLLLACASCTWLDK
jgi:hypothetical protein